MNKTSEGFFLIEFIIYSTILSLMICGFMLSSLAFHDSLFRAATAASNESSGTGILASLEEEFDAHQSLVMPSATDIPAGTTLSALTGTTTVIDSKTISTFSFSYNGENFSFTKMNR